MRQLGLLLLLGGCMQEPVITPDKIVSNNPCIDSVLAEIADPSTIGAVSRYSQDADGGSAPIAWANRFPAIGVSAEEVIAAKPRLVLTGNYASTGTNAALKKAGIRVEAFGVPATLAENRVQIRTIARAIDRTAEGADLVQRIDEATKAFKGTETAIIWQTGGFVAGRGTIQDEMLARAGFRNASSLYGLKQWDVLPLETLMRNPPDVIFTPISARGDDARALALRKRVLRHLNGSTRLIPFPEKLLFCGGPTVIAAMRVMHEARSGQ
jgi:iron complex transport system substrate-binding protein